MNKKIETDVSGDAVDSFNSTRPHEKYTLRLYVTGTTPRSQQAIVNIRKICDEHLEGRYDLEVIDIALHPRLAKGEQIIAAPTLVKKLPLPIRRFIGDMSQTERHTFRPRLATGLI